jgi:hypothetical protein
MAMPTLAPVERPPLDLDVEATRMPVDDGVIVAVVVPVGVFETVVKEAIAVGPVVSGGAPTTETVGVYNEIGKGLVGGIKA